jgi:hypothetical protein
MLTTSLVPSPDATLSFNIDSLPSSFLISSLFNTFTNGDQPPDQPSNLENPIFENMNDSLFGFMEDSSLPDTFSWV